MRGRAYEPGDTARATAPVTCNSGQRMTSIRSSDGSPSSRLTTPPR
ncbi:MAG: hypothetical protein H6719_06940 [Sandaracinaceae bacterium]|nr:hypothetical protein [Sandaracinaceae bacterium]